MAPSSINTSKKWYLTVANVGKTTKDGKQMARAVVHLVERYDDAGVQRSTRRTLPSRDVSHPLETIQIQLKVRLLLYCFSTTNILGIFRQSHLISLG
jgi:hypothetical protein